VTFDIHQHLWPESFLAALRGRKAAPFLRELGRRPLDFPTRNRRAVAALGRADLDEAYRRVATGEWSVVLVGDAASVVPALEGRVGGPVSTVAL